MSSSRFSRESECRGPGFDGFQDFLSSLKVVPSEAAQNYLNKILTIQIFNELYN